MNNTNSLSHQECDSEYLVYSSKIGVVFHQRSGRYFVDKTYSYNVNDDIQKIMKSNRLIEDQLIVQGEKDWVQLRQQQKSHLRRKALTYESDFRVISNERLVPSVVSTPIGGVQNTGAPVPLADVTVVSSSSGKEVVSKPTPIKEVKYLFITFPFPYN